MTTYPKRLIEVDLPIKKISEHARREKSIRHGHISTLHIWWAQRPLARLAPGELPWFSRIDCGVDNEALLVLRGLQLLPEDEDTSVLGSRSPGMEAVVEDRALSCRCQDEFEGILHE